jgi:enoyl-CoA hydratase/carnithine racemase
VSEGPFEHVMVDTAGAVSVVTMNRPARRNALSVPHMTELVEVFEDLGSRRDQAAVVLAGAGPVFCAGHDLDEMSGADAAFLEREFALCTRLMSVIQEIPQPVIAAVQGIATAAGCQLAATCDLVVAAADARFATPGVRIGLFCSTPMVALSRAVGRKKAMEMLLTGEPIDAEEARAAGLVNRVVPPDDLMAETMSLAQRIAAASRPVVGIGKQAFYRQIELPQRDAYDMAARVMVDNAVMDDAREGICAFLEKRPPEWRHA